MSGTVDHPNDAGFRGMFVAKAIGGCPVCQRELPEPNPPYVEPISIVCPGCETVLRWLHTPRFRGPLR